MHQVNRQKMTVLTAAGRALPYFSAVWDKNYQQSWKCRSWSRLPCCNMLQLYCQSEVSVCHCGGATNRANDSQQTLTRVILSDYQQAQRVCESTGPHRHKHMHTFPHVWKNIHKRHVGWRVSSDAGGCQLKSLTLTALAPHFITTPPLCQTLTIPLPSADQLRPEPEPPP